MSNDVVNVEKWKYGWKTAFLLYSVQVKDTLVFVWQLENVSQLYRLLITTQAVISSSNNVTAWWDFWSVCVYGGCVCYSDNTSFNNTDKHVFTASLLDEPVVRTPRTPLRSHWPWFYAPDQIISIKHMWRKSESAVCRGAISDPTDVNVILCARSFEIDEYIGDIRRSGRAASYIKFLDSSRWVNPWIVMLSLVRVSGIHTQPKVGFSYGWRKANQLRFKDRQHFIFVILFIRYLFFFCCFLDLLSSWSKCLLRCLKFVVSIL